MLGASPPDPKLEIRVLGESLLLAVGYIYGIGMKKGKMTVGIRGNCCFFDVERGNFCEIYIQSEKNTGKRIASNAI